MATVHDVVIQMSFLELNLTIGIISNNKMILLLLCLVFQFPYVYSDSNNCTSTDTALSAIDFNSGLGLNFGP